MTKSSSNSRRNRLRLLGIVLAAVAAVISIVDVGLTLVLHRGLAAVKTALAMDGLTLRVGFSYTNVFSGVSLRGVSLSRGSSAIFKAHRIHFGFNMAALFGERRLCVKNLRVGGLYAATRHGEDLMLAARRLAMTPAVPVGLDDTLRFVLVDAQSERSVRFDLKGYISFLPGDLVISRGDLWMRRVRFEAFPDLDIFAGSHFSRPFDYVLEAEVKDGALTFTRLELSNAQVKFFGKGRVDGLAAKEPRIDLSLDLSNVLLDDLPSLNQGGVRSRGVLDIAFGVTGALETPRPVWTFKLSNGEVSFKDALVFGKVQGKAIIDQGELSGRELTLDLNGVPLIADIGVVPRGTVPRIILDLYSRSKVKDEPTFGGHIEADWLEDELRGSAHGTVRYLGRGALNALRFELQDLHLGFDENLFANARTFRMGMRVYDDKKGSPKDPVETFRRDVELEHLFVVMSRRSDGFGLEPLHAVCYGGKMEGAVTLVPQGTALDIEGELHLRDVNLSKFAAPDQSAPPLSRGKLDGDLRFNNRSRDLFKGQLFVSSGEVENNPILDGVADFLGVPSLKKLPFGDLSIFFNGGRGEYAVQTKLSSSLVNATLDGKIRGYDTMDGYLSVGLATQLLNESRTFKKLLTYLKHDEPTVTFEFKISSYLPSPRILWLKNEFKEKIQNLLPQRNQRSLQKQVNAMIERMNAESGA